VLVDAEDHDLGAPSVAVDDVEGGFLAAAHLLSLGRRRLAFVGGPADVRQVADRLAGAHRALAAAPDAALEVIDVDALTVRAGRRVGDALAARPPAQRPDAVFCANDLLAVGLLQGAAILGGIRVPEELALIGYDDIDFAATAVVPLSSVRQPARRMGATAVELLLEVIADSTATRAVRFRPELVRRDSTDA
jgi:LacI family transcriptional regulator